MGVAIVVDVTTELGVGIESEALLEVDNVVVGDSVSRPNELVAKA